MFEITHGILIKHCANNALELIDNFVEWYYPAMVWKVIAVINIGFNVASLLHWFLELLYGWWLT